MSFRTLVIVVFALIVSYVPVSGQVQCWWDKDVEAALTQAKANRSELEKSLLAAPNPQRPGIAFLIANMPAKDLTALKADFLLKNLDLAYQARAKMPWGKTVPEELFLNDVLPYASVTETREPWRTFPLVWAPGAKEIFAANVTERYTVGKNGPKAKPNAPGQLSNEEETRIYEAAKDFFDNGKAVDPGLDVVLRTNENAVRQAAWRAYATSTRHKELKADFEKKQAKHEKHMSAYTVKRVGKKPKAGWPLFIAMHGGGGVPKAVNDSQWEIMKKYYRDQDAVEGYLYVALRAPNDVWNGFYDDYCCPLVANLIRQFILFGDADADKVFLMGYSHGGYGAFFIGPKMPDRFAAIHASAGAPTDGTISAKSLRNTRFTFMIGENDTAYGRRERCEKFAKEIENLRKDNPGDFPVAMELKKGFGHGGLPDRDKIKEMYGFQRNPVAKHLTWAPTDSFLKDFFWLSIDKPSRGQSIDVKIAGNKLTVQAEKVDRFAVWLDRRLIDLEQPVELIVNGKVSRFQLTPTFNTLCESILRRGDLGLAASGRIVVGP